VGRGAGGSSRRRPITCGKAATPPGSASRDWIAARFADELATNGARRTALLSFFALAPAAIGYALLLGLSRPGPDITSAKTLPLGMAAALVIALAPQISLAAGLLAIALAWRLRAVPVAPAGAISFLHRRAAVALGAGAATLAGVAVYAVEYSRGLPDSWTTLAFAVTATAIVPVAVAAAALGRTARLQARTAGPAGDVFDDLGPILDRVPLRLRGRPWRFCLLFAAAVAVLAFVGGGLDEGPCNAVAEFAAICAGFAVLGRFLGLRG
jgi:hypothetical protein